MRGRARFLAVLTILTVPSGGAWAQSATRSADGLWQAGGTAFQAAALRRTDLVGPHTIVQLDRPLLNARLAQAPAETAQNRSAASPAIITLPLPDGRFSRFRIEESPILAPALAAAFPQFKTYRGVGIDDPTATMRLDVTDAGVHAQIIAAGGTVYVDPYAPGDLVNHVAYDKTSRARTGQRAADIVDGDVADDIGARVYDEWPMTNGTVLRTYRLALAATAEYTAAAGGTKPAALSRITTSMNRVNGIYERELAVRMTVSTGPPGDPTLLIYTDAATDPYDNSNASTMLGQNQANLDAQIGSVNYDIGHVFSTYGGGVATLRAVCAGGVKARGVTGLPSPTGQVFDVDYVSHEMGHQFGANHSFNSSSGSCGANRSRDHAYEIGSGVSIMGYTGLCSPENTVVNSIDIFTIDSLNEATTFITSGGGQLCGTVTANGNVVPAVTAPTSVTIPAGTPFELTATASDANGDALTYAWEQFDRNGLTTANAWSADDGISPLFRSYAPSASQTRTFPSLSYILNNNNVPPASVVCQGGGSGCISGEVLPTTARTMNFQVIVRDNRAGGSAIATARTQVVVNPGIGPFAVSSPNTAVSMPGLSTHTVAWTVNGTNTVAANVAILLSVDGGLTYPYTLHAATPNDGAEVVTMPNVVTSTARIKVAAIGSVFFDVSNTNFSLTASTPVAPGAFGKATPSNGHTQQSRSPVLSWSASTGASSYEYCIDTSLNAACNAAWVNVGGNTAVPLTGLSTSTAFSWHVRAVNLVGTTESNGGTWWTFTTRAGGRAGAGDFDGDGRADTTVFRGSTGAWYTRAATGGVSSVGWGTAGDRPVPGDYDGDGRIDIAVFRPSNGVWYVVRSSTGTGLTVQWGAGTDNTVPADYDGDGRTDIAVYRPSSGLWYIVTSSGQFSVTQWGNGTDDRPVPADYDGDGRTDIAVYRPSTGVWYVARSSGGATATPWGFSTDVTVPADYDGDGRTDVAVYRPSSGVWYVLRSSGGSSTTVWGNSADIPAPGDYDGDARADIAVFRPADGTWYAAPSGGGAMLAVTWGSPTDTPVLGRQ